jgi:hypothetical protein
MSCCVMSASVTCKYTAYVQDSLVTLALSYMHSTVWIGRSISAEQIQMGQVSLPVSSCWAYSSVDSYLLQANDCANSSDELKTRICNDSAHRSGCVRRTLAVLLDEHETEEFSSW